MPDLETSIAEWRRRMAAALPHEPETVAELEEHLREQVAASMSHGTPADEAFRLAQQKLGEPARLAREFEQLPCIWRPARFLLLLLAVMLVAVAAVSLWTWSRPMPLTALLLVFVTLNVAGSYCVLGSGLIAAGAFVTTAWRPLRDRERRAVRRLLGRLAALAMVFLPLGLTFGGVWQAQVLTPRAWTLSGYPLRAAAMILAASLLVIGNARVKALVRTAPLRPKHDRLLWLGALFASLAFTLCGLGPRFRIADIPVAWLGVPFLAVPLLLALPRYRIVRVPERE